MSQFPFTAIVGMEPAKRSLIYHGINPRIGGTLLTGHRGCAKSTLVRAFAAVRRYVDSEPTPFVEVPLGTTEDRLLGSVDPEAVVERNRWHGQSGLIEQAHGGILYVDEINLLPDHLADSILDSAATGQYRMERDGITRTVESRYILIGTMNPEEGDLRPQLSDRLAHRVPISGGFSTEERVAIVERRLRFEDDPDTFLEEYRRSDEALGDRILAARQRLPHVSLTADQKHQIAETARSLQVEGVRRDLAVIRTALCAAAWAGRTEVTDDDIQEAWALCLGEQPTYQSPPDSGSSETPSPPSSSESDATSNAPRQAIDEPIAARPPSEESAARLQQWWQAPKDAPHRFRASRPSAASHTTADASYPIAWLASLKASILHGWPSRRRHFSLRRQMPNRRPTAWILVDASRSTGMSRFLDRARDTVVDLLGRFPRSRVQSLLLRGDQLEWRARNQPSTSARSEIRRLDHASGKSRIAEGLDTLRQAIRKRPGSQQDRILIFSDGLNSPLPGETASESQNRLRKALKRLTALGIPTAWVHPPPKRGLRQWLITLTRHGGASRIEWHG